MDTPRENSHQRVLGLAKEKSVEELREMISAYEAREERDVNRSLLLGFLLSAIVIAVFIMSVRPDMSSGDMVPIMVIMGFISMAIGTLIFGVLISMLFPSFQGHSSHREAEKALKLKREWIALHEWQSQTPPDDH